MSHYFIIINKYMAQRTSTPKAAPAVALLYHTWRKKTKTTDKADEISVHPSYPMLSINRYAISCTGQIHTSMRRGQNNRNQVNTIIILSRCYFTGYTLCMRLSISKRHLDLLRALSTTVFLLGQNIYRYFICTKYSLVDVLNVIISIITM